MPTLRRAVARMARSIQWAGLVIGLVLGASLAVMLWHDRNHRIESAQRQSMALATGAQRMLRLELRNLERAMQGIAADGSQLFRRVPDQAPELLDDAIGGVLERHAELHSIVVVDGQGRAITDGEGDTRFHAWTMPPFRGNGSAMFVGPPARLAEGGAMQGGPLQDVALQDDAAQGDTAQGDAAEHSPPHAGLVLPLALQMRDQRWLLARLHTRELDTVVFDLDAGRDGAVSISDRQGWIVSRSGSGAHVVGERFTLPRRNQAGTQRITALGVETSTIDGIPRIGAVSTLAEYPLIVYAGLGRDEVLAPWWAYVRSAALLYLGYWIIYLGVLYTARRTQRRQDALTDEVRIGTTELLMAHQVARVGAWYVGEKGDYLRWSPMARRMFGLESEQTSITAFFDHVHGDDVLRLQQAFDRAFSGAGVLDEIYRIRLRDGVERWISVRGERVDMAGYRMIGAATDITDRVMAQQGLQKAEHQFRLVFDRNPAPFWIFDLLTLRFIEVNLAAEQQYGFSREEFLDMSVLDVLPTDAVPEARRVLAALADGKIQEPVVSVHRHRDGHLFEVRTHLSVLEFNGRPACLLLVEDVSERMAYERQLAWHATHNAATGLLNVRALAELLDAQNDACTIVYVQLRRLQLVADTLGREAGEQVLQAVATRLGALGTRYGLLAYQPAEDFVFAVRGAHDRQVALDAIVQAVSEPVRGVDSYHQFEPRIGVAVRYAGDDTHGEQVIGMAAQAAHTARDEGSVVSWYDHEAAARLGERLRMAGRIHEAIEREFQLYFQPICHAADGSPVALEALLRWPQADGGFIDPGQFIQLCEDTGQILLLGRWVIRAAAQAQRQLADAGFGHISIAVNVSALQFFNSDLVGEFTSVIAEFGLARGALQVELTESSLMRKPAQAKQTMQHLHEHGICISLDDFGTGYSNMSYLQNLPLDMLKIDRSFVCDVEKNPRNASICRALLTLGHSMGLSVIAEGVETRGQYEWLAAHGCDHVQGYLLGRPAPLSRTLEMLQGIEA